VGALVDRVAGVLDGAEPAGSPGGARVGAPAGGGETVPARAQLDRLAAGGRHIEGHGRTLTVMNEDRPGMFSRVAGVLALHGLDVLAAAAWSSDEGRALAEFRIADPLRGEPPWSRVVADLKLALDGRLAIQARVGDRARPYARAGPASRVPVVPAVAFDNQASEGATVIDVRAPDAIGTLYRITRTLADFDLD